MKIGLALAPSTLVANDWHWQMIIDGSSYKNIMAQEVIDKLQIPTEKHPTPTPYRRSRFKKGNEVGNRVYMSSHFIFYRQKIS